MTTSIFLMTSKIELSELIKDIWNYEPTNYYKINKNISFIEYRFEDDTDTLNFLKKIFSTYVAQFINRYFITNYKTNNLDSIINLANIDNVRVIAFPKSLEIEILKYLENKKLKHPLQNLIKYYLL